MTDGNEEEMRAFLHAAVVIVGLSLIGGQVRAAGNQSQAANPPPTTANQAPPFTGTSPSSMARSGDSPSHGDSQQVHDFNRNLIFSQGFPERYGSFGGGYLYPSWYPYGSVSYAPVDVTPSYGSDNGNVGPGNVPPPYSATNQAPTGVAPPSGSNYKQLGVQWAQDLRRNIVVWGQFVGYVKESVLTALPSDEAEFRKGFISAYGSNADAAFDKAAEQAGEVIPKGPKIIYMGPQE